MNVNKKEVGKRIKQIRKSKGLTQQEFGKFFDASKGNVSLWEKGSSLPSNKRIKNIAAIGNITVDELLGNKNMISINDEKLKKSSNEELLEIIELVTKELRKRKENKNE